MRFTSVRFFVNLAAYAFGMACILLASACSSTEEPAASTELIPLAVGNYWVFETSTIQDDGSVNDRRLDTMSVVGSRQVDSKDKQASTWYEVYGFMVKDTILLQSRENGLWMIDKMGREVHYYRTDLELGGRYTRPPSFNIVVKDTTATVNTAAGKFTGLLFEERFGNAPSSTSYYFAPGIGLVEWVASSVMMTNGQDGSVRTTLIETNLH